MLPLAPLRGTAWIAEQVRELAEQEMYDPVALQRRLRQARAEHEAGLITSEELDAYEEAIVEVLLEDLGPMGTVEGPTGGDR